MTLVANNESVVRQRSFIMSNIWWGKAVLHMATDVVPVLNKRIKTSFQSNVMKDRRIAQISKRIRDGTATMSDGHDYAERLGENLSKALTTNLTAETLPDGKLYYNIAKRTITPALEENWNLTNEVASDIQQIIDKKTGIGLKTIRPEFPQERIQGLIDVMTKDGIILEDALKWLDEPIVNNSESFFDDFIDSNAKFRNDVGLKATITREVAFNCCEWCEALAGTYDYDKAPPDIYKRHQYCRCVVTYNSGRKVQNVWTKRQWESSPEQISERKQAGKGQNHLTAAEKIEQANLIYRDMVVSTLESKDRRKNLKAYKKMQPEERLARLKAVQEAKRG